jgi:AmmeMemoRadiSam system protein B
MDSIPAARLLEPIPVEVDGQQVVVLRDPFRFLPDPITLTLGGYLVLSLLDGRRTAADVQASLQLRFNADVGLEDIERIAADFDAHGLLESERFGLLRDRTLREFAEAPVRRATHAGTAYEGEAAALREQIDGFYAGARRRDPLDDAPEGGDGGRVCGLVAPHIDPRVGGVCAARAFAALPPAGDEAPDLFVILGTAHQPSSCLFILTEKTFQTPLGSVEVDREVARALAERSDVDLTVDEYVHKHEHSIEFQLIFLQHLYGDRHPFKILPILVGSFHDFIERNTVPSAVDGVEGFVGALRGALAASSRRVCFVAGADLSHMGHKFGDEEGPSEAAMASTRAKDREMLDCAAASRAEEMFRCVQADGDRQKVCGLPPIYTMLRLMGEGVTGRVLDYEQSVEEPTQSFVSYASLAFHRDNSLSKQ